MSQPMIAALIAGGRRFDPLAGCAGSDAAEADHARGLSRTSGPAQGRQVRRADHAGLSAPIGITGTTAIPVGSTGTHPGARDENTRNRTRRHLGNRLAGGLRVGREPV